MRGAEQWCFMMIIVVVWLTNERRLALFPAGTIARDPHHRIRTKLCISGKHCITPLSFLNFQPKCKVSSIFQVADFRVRAEG